MNEPFQDGLDAALRRLREDAGSQTAPDGLEHKLIQAFRAEQSTKRKLRGWMWIPAAVAASVLLAVASRLTEPIKVEAPVVPVASAAAKSARTEPALQAAPAAAEKRRTPARRRVKPPASRLAERLSLASSRPAPQRQEFVEIPYAPPLTPDDQGQVVRVNMAGSSARRMGVPVMLDRVQADLLVGNDGLPRAIRLVSNSGDQFR